MMLLIGLVLIGGGVAAREQLARYLGPVAAQFGSWIPGLAKTEHRFDHLITEPVKRGPFQITVIEKGQLDSMKNAVLTCQVEGGSTIIEIKREGEHVTAGEQVVLLDSSALVDKRTAQDIAVTQARAALDSAQQEYEIQETQNESDKAAVKLKLELAELDYNKFTGIVRTGDQPFESSGDYVQMKNELESQVNLNKANLLQATEMFDFTKRLVKKGYKTQNDLESARINREAQQNSYDVAAEKLNVLQQYTKDRTARELEANMLEYGRELARVEKKGIAALSVKNADRLAKKKTMEVEESKLERLDDQIKKCKITATQDGQVIYANSRDGRSADTVLIEQGATVRERQPIVTLPDLNEMKVNARIHESRISLVRTGLPVKVKVDAYPDETFQGVIDSVASVPSSTGSSFMRDIKEYEAAVRLLDEKEKINRLRPGLTASLEVLVESRDDVLQAPIQSVLTIVGRQFAFIIRGDKVERSDVTVGQINERMIEIKSGLNEGDRVVMNPKSHFEKELKELEADLAKEQALKPAEKAPTIPPPMPAPPGGERGPGGGNRPTGPGNDYQPDGAPRSGPPAGSEGRGPGGGGNFDPVAMFKRFDANSDDKLAPDELPPFLKDNMATIDKDGDGFISLEEFKSRPRGNRGPRPGGPPPENTAGGA